MILLAVAGSLPELAITISAIAQGHLDIAAGNLIGGIAMQTLVLVVCDRAVRGEHPLSYLVGSLIPLRGLLGYHARTLRYELLTRMLVRSPFAGRAIASLHHRLPRARPFVDCVLGLAPTSGGDWGMWVVARKNGTSAGRVEVQSIYRDRVAG